MPYQNDLSTLAQVVSPAYAAQQAGIQNDAANQQQELANQKAAAQLPYAGPEAAANLAQTQANTGLVNNQATGVGLRNMFTAQTQPGEVAATNAGNQVKVSSDHLQSISQLGQLAGLVAQQMDGVPAPARPAAMQQLLTKFGANPQDLQQAGLGGLLSGDPNQLRQFSQGAIQASADYQTKMAETGLKEAGATDRANITSDARVQSAQLAAQARMQAAQIQRQAKEQSQTFEQAAVAAEKSGDHAAAQRYYQAAQNIRQMAAQTTATLVGQQAPNPGFDQGGGGSNNPSTPSAPPANAPAPSQADIEAEMKRRGLLK